VIRFFFDYVSPYSYLAWTQLPALAERHGRAVEPVPVLFAALLDAHGTRGPAEVPARRRYLIRDVLRLAHQLGVPLEPPPAHPFNPLLALRVSSVPMPAEQRRALVTGLFAATWGGGGGVSDPSGVAAVLAEVGLPADLLAQAQTAEGKAAVRAQTDQALALGAFGVPTMVADGELFFGCDSLPHLERFLRGEDPVRAEVVERWERLPASATRSSGR
jgi:2-hydroxychromene-2-carboxylate isomerase